METIIRKKRKAFVDGDTCVVCGCCVKVCPKAAIQVWRGIMEKWMWTGAWAAASAPGNAPRLSLKSGRCRYEKALV